MHLQSYDLVTGRNQRTFIFTSVGPKGHIKKSIKFQPLAQEGFFNLAFGDVHPITGELDDRVRSDNNDWEKVLATVVKAVYLFTEQNPFYWVYATGSSPSRNRLYRMAIDKYLDEANADFEILAETSSGWAPYVKGVSYTAFAAQRRKH